MIVIMRRFSDIRIYDTGVSPTIEMAGGGGGGNLPMVVQTKNETEDSNREEVWGIPRRRCERNAPK